MDKKFLLAVALLGLSANAAAQTASSTMNVEIETRSITLVNTGGLNFGKVLPYSSAGSITIDPNNNVATASGAFITDATNVRRSSWAVTGVTRAAYIVTLPTSVVVSNGTQNMTVSNFIRNGYDPHLWLDAAGNGIFYVGARLNVGANQAAGIYTGMFNVTVSYY